MPARAWAVALRPEAFRARRPRRLLQPHAADASGGHTERDRWRPLGPADRRAARHVLPLSSEALRDRRLRQGVGSHHAVAHVQRERCLAGERGRADAGRCCVGAGRGVKDVRLRPSELCGRNRALRASLRAAAQGAVRLLDSSRFLAISGGTGSSCVGCLRRGSPTYAVVYCQPKVYRRNQRVIIYEPGDGAQRRVLT